jgi:hypothetical protein
MTIKIFLGVALALAAAGCVTTPLPNEELAVARESVARAEQAGAVELAPVEMQTARDKLSRAERAAADHAAEPATELAAQANVDAQLAEATARENRSQKAATELDASLQTLRQESLRGSTQPTQ